MTLLVKAGENFENQPILSVSQAGKVVALTFDDGVRPEIHCKMLDVLKEENVPATFFFIGNQLNHPALIERSIVEGHEIGNHTMSHPKLPELTDKDVNWEIREFHRILENEFEYHPKVFRAPMLQYDDRVMSLLGELGLTPINASIGTKDWSSDVSGEQVYVKATATPHDGAIILMHEVEKTAEVLPRIIAFYKHQGFEFVTVSELLSFR